MPLPKALQAPSPIAVTVRTSLRPEDAIAAIDRAARKSEFVRTDRNSRGFYRVSGEAFRDIVTLTATPYFMPGVRAGSGAMELAFAGRVVSTSDGGCEVAGQIFAPIDERQFLVTTGMGVFVILAVLAADRSLAAIVWVILVTPISQTLFAFLRHHNQRVALTSANELVRFLTDTLPDAVRADEIRRP